MPDERTSGLVTAAQRGDVDAASAVARVLAARGDDPELAHQPLAVLVGHLHLADAWEAIAAVARATDRRYSALIADAAPPEALADLVLEPSELAAAEAMLPSTAASDDAATTDGLLARIRRWWS